MALQELGETLESNFPAIGPSIRVWLTAVRELNDSACTTFTPEAALASLAWDLRRRWLRFAHESADSQIKSPVRTASVSTPSGAPIVYGYERSIEPRRLEARCAATTRVPPGWSADHVLFSSAQGALAAVLHWANSTGFWDRDSPHLLFAGNYFETQHALNAVCGRTLDWSRSKTVGNAQKAHDRPSRTILIEPVFFDEAVNVFDLAAFHRAWPNMFAADPSLIILDTTLTGPTFPLNRLLEPLAGEATPVVINIRSGLKLDQAGLELVNVGILSVYTHIATRAALLPDIGAALRHLRTVLGLGLTLDEISTLEVPWFLSMPHLRAHSRAVFDNNALLAHAMAKSNRLFAQILHPQFARPDCAWAQSPYSIARLPNANADDYRQLESILTREADRRGIQFDHGGSFGFRFHRFEAVIPDEGMGEPYLRIAMGARPGPSLQGVVDLMRDIAAAPDLESLAAQYNN
ncbi:MAG: hypothetical protein SGI91_05220 [Alphaproteobacteria bacterium]|nr:hypothetical protein [Alphaproteobacteria bacterium]